MDHLFDRRVLMEDGCTVVEGSASDEQRQFHGASLRDWHEECGCTGMMFACNCGAEFWWTDREFPCPRGEHGGWPIEPPLDHPQLEAVHKELISELLTIWQSANSPFVQTLTGLFTPAELALLPDLVREAQKDPKMNPAQLMISSDGKVGFSWVGIGLMNKMHAAVIPAHNAAPAQFGTVQLRLAALILLVIAKSC